MLVCCHLLGTGRCRTGRSVQSCHSTDWGQLERLCCRGIAMGYVRVGFWDAGYFIIWCLMLGLPLPCVSVAPLSPWGSWIAREVRSEETVSSSPSIWYAHDWAAILSAKTWKGLIHLKLLRTDVGEFPRETAQPLAYSVEFMLRLTWEL